MNGINQADMKMLSTIIFWALHYDTITPQLLILHFNCSEEFANAVIVAMHSMGVLNKKNPNNDKEPWIVTYTELTDIPGDMLNLLQMNGYDFKQIAEALKGLPATKKKVSSNILTDTTHSWKTIEDGYPDIDVPVVIRLFDPGKIYMESRTEIVYIEDIKIASWNGVEWIIRGPFPLFDFSTCSKLTKVNEGVKVTHWASSTEKEISQWDHRYDPLYNYTDLKLFVDNDHLESLYKALILAASSLSKEAIQYPSDNEIRQRYEAAYKYICDLQTAIDRGGDINALDKG